MRLKNLEPKLFTRPDRPGWYLRWYDPDSGQRMKRALDEATTLAEATACWQAKKDELALQRRGLLANTAAPGQTRTTVGACLDLVQGDYTRRGRKAWAATRVDVETWRVRLGGRLAMSLTVPMLDAAVDEWLAQQYATATINRRLAILYRALALGVEKRILPRLPDCKVAKLRPATPKQGFFEDADFMKFQAAWRPSEAALRDACEWSFITGWRINELRTLTWQTVSRPARELRLPDSKSGEGRVIPLDGPLWQIIERRHQARQLGCPYVFHVAGRRLGALKSEWARTWKTAGLPLVDRLVRSRKDRTQTRTIRMPALSFHDFRRTAVRNMIDAKVDPQVAKAITGHKTDHMLWRYRIVRSENLTAAIRATVAGVANRLQRKTGTD